MRQFKHIQLQLVNFSINLKNRLKSNSSPKKKKKNEEINPRDYRAWYGIGQAYEILKLGKPTVICDTFFVVIIFT